MDWGNTERMGNKKCKESVFLWKRIKHNITKENLKEQGVAVISYGQIHSKLNPFYKISDDLIKFVDESYLKTGNLSLVNQGDFIFADTSEECQNYDYNQSQKFREGDQNGK